MNSRTGCTIVRCAASKHTSEGRQKCMRGEFAYAAGSPVVQ